MLTILLLITFASAQYDRPLIEDEKDIQVARCSSFTTTKQPSWEDLEQNVTDIIVDAVHDSDPKTGDVLAKYPARCMCHIDRFQEYDFDVIFRPNRGNVTRATFWVKGTENIESPVIFILRSSIDRIYRDDFKVCMFNMNNFFLEIQRREKHDDDRLFTVATKVFKGPGVTMYNDIWKEYTVEADGGKSYVRLLEKVSLFGLEFEVPVVTAYDRRWNVTEGSWRLEVRRGKDVEIKICDEGCPCSANLAVKSVTLMCLCLKLLGIVKAKVY